MNSFPTYAVWDDEVRGWYGGRISFTTTTNKDKAIQIANTLALTQLPGLGYHVVESWGEGHYDKNVHSVDGKFGVELDLNQGD